MKKCAFASETRVKLSLTLMQKLKLVCPEFANHSTTPTPPCSHAAAHAHASAIEKFQARQLHQKIKLVKCKTKAQQKHKLQQNAESVTIDGAEVVAQRGRGRGNERQGRRCHS